MAVLSALERDRYGYLRNAGDWSRDVAIAMADEDGLQLTEPHWQVIEALREFHQRYRLTPNSRVLVKLVREKLGPDCGNSAWLMQMFPDGALKQSTKIAGLPRPEQCF